MSDRRDPLIVWIVADVNEPGYGFSIEEGDFGAATLEAAVDLARSMGYVPHVEGEPEPRR